MIMFDAGEGIQLALKRGGLGIRALDAVAITHLHADHILGLPGILMFRAQNDDPGPLTIIGPPGVRRFVQHTLEDLRYHKNYELIFHEWSPDSGEDAWSWNGHSLKWRPLEHSTFCLGYRLEEAERPGRFFPEKARALGIPEGPLWGQLQQGKGVTLDNGTEVGPLDVLGETRRGRSVAFGTDTRPCDNLVSLCAGVDLAVIEGMFTREHQDDAVEKKHMTSTEAGRIAKDAGAQRLVLVHISPRYSLNDEKQIAAEASEHFPGATVGRGLDSFEIPLPD